MRKLAGLGILFLILAVFSISLGNWLNVLVISHNNGKMPVNTDQIIDDGRHTLLTDDTKYPYLADIIDVPPYIMSVGDIGIYSGMLFLLDSAQIFVVVLLISLGRILYLCVQNRNLI